MVCKLISINEVIAKIVRDLNLTNQINNQDMIEWIAEALQFIGSYAQYNIKLCTVHIEDFKAKLPCDFYKPTNKIIQTFQTGDLTLGSGPAVDYRIELGYIIACQTDVDILLEYLAIPTDCDGFPMVPDDESYKTACFWYVAKMLALQGKIKNPQLNFAYCHSRWDRYCGQARTQGNMLGVDGTQAVTNQYYKLVPDLNEYYKNFASLGVQQLLNRDKR